MNIGILSLQGAFAEHGAILDELGVGYIEIRNRNHLSEPIDGLIIPGGESTTIGKLLRDLHMYETLKRQITNGLPVFGTCAGLLLLAKEIENETARGFQTMEITAKRNAYGRQLGSFYTEDEFQGVGNVPMTFIRAPYIVKASDSVEILAKTGGRIVAARQDNQLVTAFHPELSEDVRVHRYFIEMIKNKNNRR